MSRITLIALGAATGVLISGCGQDRPADPCNPTNNPIDRVLCQEFRDAGYEPVVAAPAERCTRLWIDMLGVRPTQDNLDWCSGHDPREVVHAIQAMPAYRETQRRRWADTLKYNEYFTDVAWIKDTDAMVEELYSSRLDYAEFGQQILTHPGFVSRFIGYGQPELVSAAAFEAFLGRKATQPEAIDVGNLWRPWFTDGFLEGDGPAADGAAAQREIPPPAGVMYAPLVWIDPTMCESGVRACKSTLLGDAEVRFPANGRTNWIEITALTAEDWKALSVPGQLFVSQPMYWEAQVDAVLQRYLGYDFGSQQPSARQELVRWFQTRPDVAALERYVLTSWAYLQSANVDADPNPRPSTIEHKAWAYGPTKLMIPETWLKSVGALTGTDVGDCDWRYPNLPDWYYQDPNVDAVLEDIYPRLGDGNVDRWFRDTAAGMGGCPGTFDYFTYTTRDRAHHMGLMVAVAQEEAILELCSLRPVPGLLPEGIVSTDTDEANLRVTIRHLLQGTGFPAGDAEVDLVWDRAATGCIGCDAENLARDLCVGLTGATRYTFY